MKNFEQVFDYRFPNCEWPIAGLKVRLPALAEKFGLKLESWDEDGLGEMLGVLLKLPSGRVVLLRESQHLLKHFPERGRLTVSFDAREVGGAGVEPLMDELYTCLELNPDALVYLAENAQRSAADWCERAGSQLNTPKNADLT